MKTMIIAEIGSNFRNLDDIKRSIDSAIESGASVAKLQCWKTERLCSEQRDPKHYATLKQYELPEEWIRELRGWPVFYSVFSEDRVDFLEAEINPNMYKIASPDYKNFSLIGKCLSTEKEVLISVPISGEEHGLIKNDKISYLLCNATYPARKACLGDWTGRWMLMLASIYKGYSDHTLSLLTPSLVVALGGKIIEKHYKLENMDTPDNGHSLLPSEFKKMVEFIKEAEHHLEQSGEQDIAEEMTNLLTAKRGKDGLRPLRV